ncbi:1-phosphofructokinase family hexose kinase [Sphingomonas oligophenolica]|uniref:Phosphofructokinase n=1 Tax=Sphingomonas oligophenolica TaxID=301154 RepID=A0ABU9Y8E6_9SPHN
MALPDTTGIVTLTMNPALDVSTRTPELRPTEKLRCGEPRHEPGGGGINVARVIAALGGEATALFPSGGPAGRMIEQLLGKAGVPFKAVPIAGDTRESFNVDETNTGRQYRFILPGPWLTVREQAMLFETLAKFSPAPRYIVASGSLPPGVEGDFYFRLGSICGALGARLLFDAPGEVLAGSAGSGALLIKPNLLELEKAAGRPLRTRHQRVNAARCLIAADVAETVIVSNGARGVLLVTATEEEMISAPHVPVLSAVGAGDSMVGAMTLGLSRGMTMRDAVRYGMAAGAATVMTPAGMLARREDTERIFLELSEEGKSDPLIRRIESPAGGKSIQSAQCSVPAAHGAPGDANGPYA